MADTLRTASGRGRQDSKTAMPPILQAGFRPFFLAAALWALCVVLLWVAALSGAIGLPTAFDPLTWHRHEMLFGFLGAAIAGFLLTAIPNWTGRPPMHGVGLAALATLWVGGRGAVLFSRTLGAGTAAALDVGFLLVLFGLAAREVIAAKNRNVPILAALLLFAAGNALDHAEAMGAGIPAGIGWRLGFAIVLLLIALIGGRIIPSFTGNWLKKRGVEHGLPPQTGRFDVAALALAAVALLGWVAAPDALPTALLLLLAGVLQAARLVRWAGWRIVGDPLVAILHLSFAWLALGLVLLGASIAVPFFPQSAALHALGAGAMGSMTLAVMTRATLGHTGRELRADAATRLLYLLVTGGAALRVAAPLLPFNYQRSVEMAGALWAGAFLLFLFSYSPKLVGVRLDRCASV